MKTFMQDDDRLLQIAEAMLVATAILVFIAGFWLVNIVANA